MFHHGQDRLAEIQRVERILGSAIRDLTIRNAANLSFIEVYAAAIRAIEARAKAPSDEIRERARKVSAECGLVHDFDAKPARIPA